MKSQDLTREIVQKDTLRFRLALIFRQHRERRTLTQEAFAEILSLDKVYYGRVERGQNMTLRTLEHIAAKLDVSPSKLLAAAEDLHLNEMPRFNRGRSPTVNI